MNGLSDGGAIAPGLTPDHPYPGLLPFGERDQTFFHGRDAEQVELFRLVRSKVLTVLFGQSGLGKTSLLQAGLFPRLREAQALPVAVRLNFDTAEVDLMDAARRAIVAGLAVWRVDAPPPEPALTLWEYFHRTPWWDRRNRLLTPVLVFDQFEELFTLGRNDARAAALLEQLADLAENRIPAAVRARLEQGAALDFDYNQPNYALVISLREDFLPDLDDLRDRLPSLLQNRLRLLPLNGAQALEAVAQPAPELLGPTLAEEIVRFVAGAERGSPTAREERALADLTVEPALLALVCQQLNQRRLQQKQAAITADLLRGSRDPLLPDFYERCVADVGVGVRQFIEERLLTASGFRRAEAVDDALRWPGVSETALATLIDRRLLRREERFGAPHIELVHDVLTGTVQASRDRRRQREAARKRRRRWLLAGGTVGGIAMLALVTALVFAKLYWQAETQRQLAEQHRQQAEQLIHFMLFDLRDSLEKVGRLDLLEQPAQSALDYFFRLPETEMTPETVSQRGVALNNIGNVFMAKGDLNKALTAYQASLAIAERGPAGPGQRPVATRPGSKFGESVFHFAVRPSVPGSHRRR